MEKRESKKRAAGDGEKEWKRSRSVKRRKKGKVHLRRGERNRTFGLGADDHVHGNHSSHGCSECLLSSSINRKTHDDRVQCLLTYFGLSLSFLSFVSYL